jgi:hypothetical protein
MKKILTILGLLASVAVFGQNSAQVRVATTVGELRSRVPVGNEALTVLGKSAAGDFGPARTFRSVTGLPSSGTNVAHVFASGVANVYWVSTDRSASDQDARWWGAFPDDGVDDTSALQAAIDYCGDDKWLVIPDGQLITSSMLTLREGTKIRGQAWNSRITVSHNGHGIGYLGVTVATNRIYYVFLRDFRMDTGVGFSPSNALHLIDVSDSKFVNVDTTTGAGGGFQKGVYTYGNYDTVGAVYGGNWRNSFQNCDFYIRNGPDTWCYYGDGGPSLAGGPNDTVLKDCYFNSAGPASNGGTGGVFYRNANRFTVRDSGFEGYLTNGVWVGTDSQSWNILNNRFENQGGTSATRRLIQAPEWTSQGGIVFGNMMLIQGSAGSTTRISPVDYPGHILDPSFEGPQQILGNLIVGTHPSQLVSTYGPQATSRMWLMSTNANATNAFTLGNYDDVNNPRASLIQKSTTDGTNRFNELAIVSSGSSGANEIRFLNGTTTNASMTSVGVGIMGEPKTSSALVAYGSAGFGPDPTSPFQEGYTTVPHLLYIRESTTNRIGLWAGTIEGVENRRFELIVNPAAKTMDITHGYSTGGGTTRLNVGARTTAEFTDSLFTINTNLVVADGASITLGGVARTSWPSGSGGTNSSRVFWGGAEVADPNFVSSATVERVAPASTTNLAFQVVDSSITSNKLASATITPDKLTALSSADLRGKISDETGIGAAVFAGGDIGAATATTASASSSNTLVATTAYVDRAVGSGGGGSGDVVGPASSTDSVVALYDGTTGKLLKNGTLTESAIATDAEVAAGYQPLDSDLTAVAGLASSGLIARTGSGTVAARTITGDSEIAVSNGSGVSGNPTLSIGAAIARLASPAFTGTPTVPTASANSSNTTAASTAYVDRALVAGVTKTLYSGTAAQGQPPSSAYATFSTRNAIGVLEFDHTTQEATRWIFHLPTEYTYSGGVNVVVQWATSATSGDGRWGARIARLTGVDIDSDTFGTAVEATTTTSGTAGLVNTTTLSAVGVDSAAAGELVMLELYRDTGDAADTINSNDLQVFGIRVNLP